MRLRLILVMMVCAFTASAQTYTEHLQTRVSGAGVVTIHQSKEIEELVNATAVATPANKDVEKKKDEKKTSATTSASTTEHSKANVVDNSALYEEPEAAPDMSKKVMKGQKVSGYRVQIYAGGNSRNDKIKAESIGNEIKSRFPGQPVYVHFYSPRWICRMGNYRTQEEAQEILLRVKSMGYKQACIVKGTITVQN